MGGLRNCCGGCSSSKSIIKGIEFTLPSNLTITDYFRKCLSVEATIDGNSPAILSGDGQSVKHTFNQLDSLSTKFAKALRQHLGFWTSNSPDGDLVMAFSLPVSEYIPIIILAILKLGGTFLAIPTTFAEQHIIKLVGVTRPFLVIIESSEPAIARYQCISSLLTVIPFDEIWHLAMHGGYDDINEVTPLETLLKPVKRMASIVYTAGTMDQQLAVRIGHREILNRCLWQYKTFPYMAREVASVTSGLEDVDSIAEILAPLLAGVPLDLIPKYVLTKPLFLIRRIHEARLSRITLAPPQLAALLNAYEEMEETEKSKKPLASLKYWMISGDTLSLNLARRFFKLLCNDDYDDSIYLEESYEHGLHSAHSNHNQNHKHNSKSHLSTSTGNLTKISLLSTACQNKLSLIHLYGSTEVMSDVSYETFENCWHVRNKFKDGKVSIGRPIGNTIIYVVDEDMRIVENGAIGEICVAGACVASGHYVTGVDKDDSDRFRPNPFTKNKAYSIIYKTEDFGRILDNKFGVPHLFFEGRTEEKAKVNGKTVDLKEIAKYVNDTKLIEQCSVFCYHAGKEDQAIVACCQLSPDVTSKDLETALRNAITDKDFIPRIFPMAALHYLPSGRLDKHKMFKAYKYHVIDATPEEWDLATPAPAFTVQKNAAKILYTTIALQTGNTLRTVLNAYQSPLWSIGVNSFNALSIFLKIRESGYIVELTEFLRAESMISIVSSMRAKTKTDMPGPSKSQITRLIQPNYKLYSTESISPLEKDKVINLLSRAYSQRSYLRCYLPASSDDYKKLLECNWNQIINENLSVCIYTSNNKQTLVGVCIVLDAYSKFKQPPNCSQPIKYLNELKLFCEKKPKEHIIWKKKGTATQIIMMAVEDSISSLESILLIMRLLNAANTRARMMGYNGAMVMAMDPFLKDLCDGICHHKILEEMEIHQFRAKDNSSPFRLAFHHEKVYVFYESF